MKPNRSAVICAFVIGLLLPIIVGYALLLKAARDPQHSRSNSKLEVEDQKQLNKLFERVNYVH